MNVVPTEKGSSPFLSRSYSSPSILTLCSFDLQTCATGRRSLPSSLLPPSSSNPFPSPTHPLFPRHSNHNKTAGCTDAEIEGFHAQLSPPEGSEHARMVDVWRERNPDLEGHYSYYSFRFQCRSKGIGWRLDMAIVRLVPFSLISSSPRP